MFQATPAHSKIDRKPSAPQQSLPAKETEFAAIANRSNHLAVAVPELDGRGGADGRIRTGDLSLTRRSLCHLSYVGASPDYRRVAAWPGPYRRSARSRYLVDLRRQHEVVHRQASRVVRPQLDAHAAPADQQVRVVALRLGDRRDPVHEVDGCDEVREAELPDELPVAVGLIDLPAGQLPEQPRLLVHGHWLDAPLAGDAVAFSKRCFHAYSLPGKWQ